MNAKIFRRASVVFLAVCLSWLACAAPTTVAPSQDMLAQFTSGGHVLGFGAGEFFLSNATYVLRVQFVGANAVTPQSDATNQTTENSVRSPQAAALSRVIYANLWDGITLAYDRGGGIVRSTYRIAPGADVSAIRLQYNAPIMLNADGSLTTKFETGAINETAPIAWQELDGARVSVPVEFSLVQSSSISNLQSPISMLSFTVGAYDASQPLWIDPTLTWNTFLGGSGTDNGYGIAVDTSGYVYVAGNSDALWGSPLNGHGGGTDAFAAKLNASAGALTWHTFLGGSGNDYGEGIAVDSSGNVYVTGRSDATWGTMPKNGHSGNEDAFAAKLNASGTLLWNTFLGSSENDGGTSIAIDSSGDVYVAGYSGATWGTPNNGYSGDTDMFAAKLAASDGALLWNTFLGGSSNDIGYGIAVYTNTNVYVTGRSFSSWGSTIKRPYTSGADAFAAKLVASDGALTWNTFLGDSGTDYGYGIAVDSSGNVYVTGFSNTLWGSPVRAFTGDADAFAAKLAADGTLTWNTFLGDSGTDSGKSIAVDSSGDVYVAGYSNATWETPVNAFSGGYNAFAAKLAVDGALTWNTFLGDSGTNGNGIAVDSSKRVYVAGAGYDDAFAAKLGPICTATNGNWSESATWDCGAVPGNGDNVLISSGKTVTLNVNTANLDSMALGGTLTNNGSPFTVTLTGNWNNNGTFTPSTFITVQFNGTGAQTLTGATSFQNLTIANSGGSVTLANETTVGGILTLTSDLSAENSVLVLNSSATVAGASDVVGAVRRISPITGANLQFNNQYTLLNFVTAPPQMEIFLTKSTPFDFPNAVKREYTLTPSDTAKATVQLAYKDTELNGNSEANMQLWRHDGSSWQAEGGTVNDTDNYVSVSNIENFSPWGIGQSAPTVTNLTQFSAKFAPKRDVVRVKWETGSELNVVGFNVWRKKAHSEWQMANSEMISAKQVGQVLGGAYRFSDKKLKAGKTYRYKLEIVLANGTSEWSEVARVNLPK